MWPCTLKSGWRKVHTCRFRLRKVVFLPCWCWWKAQQSCAHAREECNKYDLTRDPCFLLAHHNDSSRWFAISSSHIFAVPVSVLWVGLQKSKITKLGCQKYFLQGQILNSKNSSSSKWSWVMTSWPDFRSWCNKGCQWQV
jgi:hypothetical protein